MKSTLSVLIPWITGLFITAVVFVAPVSARQQWWFDVEVIVFKRLESAAELDENFGSWQAIDTSSGVDLFTPYLFPNVERVKASLPTCYPKVEPTPSRDSLKQALLDFERAAATIEENVESAELLANDDFVINDESSFAEDTIDTDVSETDNLFLQLEQEQLASDTDFGGISALSLSDDELEEAFDSLLAKIDEDISWVELEPLDSVACQFESEMRYFADLLTPFELPPKVVEQTPLNIAPPYANYTGKPYLLPRNNFQLTTMAKDLNRQRGVRIISHMLWRQEVLFGRSKAQSFRLLAGKNYGNDYQLNGEKHPEYALESEGQSLDNIPLVSQQDDLISQVSAIIEGNSPSKSLEQTLFESELARMQKEYSVSQDSNDTLEENITYPPVWEVDGLFKVYLQNLGQTPYLHIDSQLNYRQPGQLPVDSELASFQRSDPSINSDHEAFLHSYNFQQLRRIISKQIHYFDHPAFGLIVQLRRYRPPVNDED